MVLRRQKSSENMSLYDFTENGIFHKPLFPIKGTIISSRHPIAIYRFLSDTVFNTEKAHIYFKSC